MLCKRDLDLGPLKSVLWVSCKMLKYKEVPFHVSSKLLPSVLLSFAGSSFISLLIEIKLESFCPQILWLARVGR